MHVWCSVFGRFLAPARQIKGLTSLNKDDNEVIVMEASLDNASKDMMNVVHRRDQKLEVGDTTTLRQEYSYIKSVKDIDA